MKCAFSSTRATAASISTRMRAYCALRSTMGRLVGWAIAAGRPSCGSERRREPRSLPMHRHRKQLPENHLRGVFLAIDEGERAAARRLAGAGIAHEAHGGFDGGPAGRKRLDQAFGGEEL